MNKHLRYLTLARNASEFSDYESQHIGCILLYRKHIASVGYNVNRTHPVQAEYNRYRNLKGYNITPKGHAEVMCLNKVKYSNIPFEDCILYVYREWKDGTFAMARPCKGCMKLIVEEYGIKKIVYTTYGGYAVEYLT